MAPPSVAASISARVIEFAVTKGAPRDALLRRSGISSSVLEEADARVPLAGHVALLRCAKTLCADPAFALHYGGAVNLAEVSLVGLIGYASETMLDAFAQLQRYSRLIMDIDLGSQARFTLDRDAAGLWIVDNRPDPNDIPELTEVAFAQMVLGTRQFGDTPFVLDVEVTHQDPGYRDEYERLLGAPTAFGRNRNAMRIDEAWLTRRVAAQPRYAFAILAQHADALLAHLEAADTWSARVEKFLLPVLHKGDARMAAAAVGLGCSRDTLYRRLKSEGATFEQILDRLRRRMALDYLGGRKVSVNETAYLLGFSDPAAFSRAFKRWEGRSPREFRNARAATAACGPDL